MVFSTESRPPGIQTHRSPHEAPDIRPGYVKVEELACAEMFAQEWPCRKTVWRGHSCPPSRRAAKECSPRPKPWGPGMKGISPGGANETIPTRPKAASRKPK